MDRIEEIRQLKDGWLDGAGLAPRRAFWHAMAKVGDGGSALEVDLGTELGWAELAHLIRGHCRDAG